MFVYISYKTAKVVGLTPSMRSHENKLYTTNLFLVNNMSRNTAIYCLLMNGTSKMFAKFCHLKRFFAILICHIGHTINLRDLISLLL